MAGNVQAVGRPAQHAGAQPTVCAKFYQLAEVITQIAVKILFVVGSILVSAAAFPIAWHAIVIPFVAISATLLAGFFYPQPSPISGALFQVLQPLVRPVQVAANGQFPADFPADAPRGLLNRYQNVGAQNCPFNSMAEFIDNEPELAHWLRHPLTDAIDMPTFRNAMAEYAPPAYVLDQFNAYYDGLPAAERPPIPAAFTAFLQQFVAPLADANVVDAFKSTYQNLRLIQAPFSQFFAAYDQAVQGRLAVTAGNSQNLRVALSQVTALVDPNPHQQMDIAQVMDPFLSLLPDRLKARIETTYYLNTTGLPAVIDPPQPKVERVGLLSLPIPPGIPRNLEALYQNYCNNGDVDPLKCWGVDGVRRSYPIERVTVSLVEPPSALRFQIKRFSSERPPESFFNRWIPSLFPRLPPREVKINDAIESPNEFSVTLKDGRVCRYRLASFVNHSGTCGGGHYTSARIVNGHKYLISDTQVTLVTPELEATWNEQLRHAYLLCYLPVPDGAAPAA
jgi:hypothetical protein